MVIVTRGVKCRTAPVAAAVALVLLSACAGPQVLPRQGGAVELALPGGPIDEQLDRMRSGDSLKAKVAVLEVSTPGEVNLRLQEILITSLVQTGRVDVLERARLDQMTAEHKLSLEKLLGLGGGIADKPLIDPKTAPKLGKLLGAQAIVLGAVSSATRDKVDMFAYDLVRFKVTVDVRAVDTTSGRIFLSETSTGMVEAKVYTTANGVVIVGAENLDSGYVDAAKQAVNAIAVKIGTHYPLVGNVVRVRDSSVYLNVGQAQGARPGDRFVVFRRGEEISDPDRGERLGSEKDVIAVVTVPAPEGRMSRAQVVRLRDPKVPIQPGDFVISADAR